jgi:hypothetical protein
MVTVEMREDDARNGGWVDSDAPDGFDNLSGVP